METVEKVLQSLGFEEAEISPHINLTYPKYTVIITNNDFTTTS